MCGSQIWVTPSSRALVSYQVSGVATRMRASIARPTKPQYKGIARERGRPILRLYDYLPSGNGYKVRLLLCQLGLAFELVEVDILKGEARTPEFLAINPNCKIPALE